LLTAEYKEQMRKDEVKKFELHADDLTPNEDPALPCSVCKRHFHLVCVYDEIQLQNWAMSNPKAFCCQEYERLSFENS
jgi:hypothetical protein